MGSGLASSAALECAVLGAIASATDLRSSKVEQARIAQRAENEYVGAPTGLLDQLAALFGEERHALLIDFRDLSVQPVRFDPDAPVWRCCSWIRVPRTSTRAASTPPGARRASGRQPTLAVTSLRDVQDLGLSVSLGHGPDRHPSRPPYPHREPARARFRCGTGRISTSPKRVGC